MNGYVIIILTIPHASVFFEDMQTWGFLFLGDSMHQKEFKTIDEQLTILKSRGLNIIDEEVFKNFLLNNNYYRVSGYTLSLRKNDVFDKKITSSDIIDIYNCDAEMRNVLFEALVKVECRIKSIFAYTYSMITKDPYDYKNIDNYCIEPYKIKPNDKDYAKIAAQRYNTFYKIIGKVDKVKSQDEKYELYLKHYKDKYDDKLPLWIYVELMTFSDITQLFDLLTLKIKNQIVKFVGYPKVSVLSKHLYCLSLLRNFCAHGHRLYGRKFITKPILDSANSSKLLIVNGNAIDDKLYSYYLALQQILLTKDKDILIEKIKKIFMKYKSITIDEYGFPLSWK